MPCSVIYKSMFPEIRTHMDDDFKDSEDSTVSDAALDGMFEVEGDDDDEFGGADTDNEEE